MASLNDVFPGFIKQENYQQRIQRQTIDRFTCPKCKHVNKHDNKSIATKIKCEKCTCIFSNGKGTKIIYDVTGKKIQRLQWYNGKIIGSFPVVNNNTSSSSSSLDRFFENKIPQQPKIPGRKSNALPGIKNISSVCLQSYPCHHKIEYVDRDGTYHNTTMNAVSILKLYGKFGQRPNPHIASYRNYPN